MATMFGRFEIQSELSKSETASIYKAMDTETNQVVALKTQSLEPLGEFAEGFVETLIAEGERTRDLVGQNIVLLYGAGEIDGQFCATMEYIQGNSVATMLARKEGFSIWDLLDITRQVCAGLEHAAAKGIAHYSLEPAKILVQWDGMVKILGYGISHMSLIEAECGKGLGRLMPYCSPEQIRGEAIDPRSNVFTLGTILYEMVVGQKAFDGGDPATLLTQIENEMPPAPVSVNAKISPAVSELIMKSLAKEPGGRYQSARELVADLEQCKENGKKAAVETKKPVTASAVTVDAAARAAAASKFVSAGAGASRPEAAARPASPPPAAPAVQAPAREKAAAAGAATGGSASHYGSDVSTTKSARTNSASVTEPIPSTGNGAPPVTDFDVNASESWNAPSPQLSAAAPAPAIEQPPARSAVQPPKSKPAPNPFASPASGSGASTVKADPAMAEAAPSSTGRSFQTWPRCRPSRNQ